MPIRGLSRRDQPLFRPNVVLNSHHELHVRLRSTASGFAESPLLWLNVRFAVVKPTSFMVSITSVPDLSVEDHRIGARITRGHGSFAWSPCSDSPSVPP